MTSRLLQFVLPLLVAALASLALTPLARRLAIAVGAVDRPNPRKVHREPMPLLGGVAVIGSIVLTFTLLGLAWPNHAVRTINGSFVIGIGLGLVPIVFVSLWDDIRALPAWPKIIAHGVGAAIAISFGVCLSPVVHLFGREVYIGVLAIPLSMLWIMGVTNAFNIVDGLDGLSAGLALVSTASLAAIFSIEHELGMAAAAVVVAGGLIGFLPYNLHPARIFLGDTGATAIGFFLGCLALPGSATLSSGFAAAMPVFLLGLPITDTAVSMARRTIRRISQPGSNHLYEADRNHFHHRLLARGIGHRKVVFILYGVGLFFAAAGMLSILMRAFDAGLLLLGLLMAGFVGVARLGYEEFAVIRSGLVLRFYEAPVLRKSFFSVFADAAMVMFAVYVALALKLDKWDLTSFGTQAMTMVAVLVPTTVVALWSFKLYRGTWRLAALDDFRRLTLAILSATFISLLAHRLMFGDQSPSSVFVIYALVKMILASGARISYRVLVSRRDAAREDGIPVLVYGAGMTGGLLLPQLLANDAFGMRAVGFIDDDPAKSGGMVNGVPVWGDIGSLERAVAETSARKLIMACRHVTPERLDAARSECKRLSIEVVRMEIEFDRRLVRRPQRRELRLVDGDFDPAVESVGGYRASGNDRRELRAGSTDRRRADRRSGTYAGAREQHSVHVGPWRAAK
ncbi:MAG: hypothetical protein NTV05_11455 [Acidobacteria bacterium]|nr:hypothetical protein [Acidobacteriota bacterium]